MPKLTKTSPAQKNVQFIAPDAYPQMISKQGAARANARLGLLEPAIADAIGDPKAVKQDELGKWTDADGNPTYKIEADGTLAGLWKAGTGEETLTPSR